MAKPKKNVALVTPLAVSSLPVGFHLTYIGAIQYLQQNLKKLPFEINDLRMVAPGTFPIDANRNECVAWIKKWEIDISVWIDADQYLKPDTIFNLLYYGWKYPIYAGMYYLKYSPYYPVVFKSNEEFNIHHPILIFPDDSLFYADMIGMGCCKIDREVIDMLDNPYFAYQRIPYQIAELSEYGKFKFKSGINDVSEDVWFWKQVRDKTNYKIVIDPKIQVGHITSFPINYAIYKSYYEEQKVKVKQQLSEEEYNKFWDKVCRADLVKNES